VLLFVRALPIWWWFVSNYTFTESASITDSKSCKSTLNKVSHNQEEVLVAFGGRLREVWELNLPVSDMETNFSWRMTSVRVSGRGRLRPLPENALDEYTILLLQHTPNNLFEIWADIVLLLLAPLSHQTFQYENPRSLKVNNRKQRLKTQSSKGIETITRLMWALTGNVLVNMRFKRHKSDT
jgi:hypothetical protein